MEEGIAKANIDVHTGKQFFFLFFFFLQFPLPHWVTSLWYNEEAKLVLTTIVFSTSSRRDDNLTRVLNTHVFLSRVLVTWHPHRETPNPGVLHLGTPQERIQRPRITCFGTSYRTTYYPDPHPRTHLRILCPGHPIKELLLERLLLKKFPFRDSSQRDSSPRDFTQGLLILRLLAQGFLTKEFLV